jgi:serine protease Do
MDREHENMNSSIEEERSTVIEDETDAPSLTTAKEPGDTTPQQASAPASAPAVAFATPKAKKKKTGSTANKVTIAVISVFLAVLIALTTLTSALALLVTGGAAITLSVLPILFEQIVPPDIDILPEPENSKNNSQENEPPAPDHYGNGYWYNPDDLTNDDLTAYEKVCARCNPSVVAIATDVGSGSGVVWSADGYIVTNHHVIDGARSVKVMLANNEEYPATIIGSNAENDLALLRINVTGLLPAQLGNSDALRMGQPVVAIGNPLGTLSNTATEGIVSATSREITVEGQTMTLMQISAPINPGNSGGGCFDINGKLIGIVNAKTSAAGIEGLGFAIPVNTAKTVIGAMLSKDNTTLQKGVGVTGCYEITKENYADFADIELLKQIEHLQGGPLYGIYIISDDMVDYVDPNGNVFENGDVLHKINGKEVKTLADVAKIVNDCSVGQELAITVLRLMQSGNVLRPTYSLVEYSFQIRVIQMYK